MNTITTVADRKFHTHSKKINSRLISLPKHMHTIRHTHHEVEIWHILQGNGIVQYHNKQIEIQQGENILLHPLYAHLIRNTGKEDLKFLAIWWDSPNFINQSVIALNNNFDDSQMENLMFILPSFPTPNGDLHVGHLAGPYIAADIYKRYQLMLGHKVFQLLGTVGHQTQVTRKAQENNSDFYLTAADNSDEIIKTLRSYQINPDIFVTLSNASSYHYIAQDFFIYLYESNCLIQDKRPTLYCEKCKKYLFEAHVIGICPKCLTPNASANECECCGQFHNDYELINPQCTTCHTQVNLRQLERFYFSLENMRKPLENYYQNTEMAPKLSAFLANVLQQKLPDIPITFIATEGIPVPLVNFINQRLYSLFELPARYICAVYELKKKHNFPEEWYDLCKKYSTKLFFGFDNAYLRAIIFPALLLAYDKTFKLPDLLISNEFYHLENKKFSTSNNHATWGRELTEKYHVDLIRFYLSMNRPEVTTTNFSLDALDNFIKYIFHDNWQSWLNDLHYLLQTYFQSSAPELKLWDPSAKYFYLKICKTHHEINQLYQSPTFLLSKICALLINLITESHSFLKITQDNYSLESLRPFTSTYLALELMSVKYLTILVAPIMPNFAINMWLALGFDTDISTVKPNQYLQWIPAGQRIQPLGKVFD